MPWELVVGETANVIELRYAGLLTPAELAAAVAATFARIPPAGVVRVFADASKLTGGHSVFDLYDLADAIESSGIGDRLREAVLLPAAHAAAVDARFWETTCLNRGLQVKAFSDRAAAMAWLLEAPQG